MDETGAVTLVYAFARTDGAYPYAGLVEGTDGCLYGTTTSGGSSGGGTVFRVDPAGAVTVLHAFTSSEGTSPYGALIQGTDGFFYGTTSRGGPQDAGTVYRMTASGTVTLFHAFTGADGASPQAALTQTRDGFFYGTTTGGGAYSIGTIFRVTPVPGTLPATLSVSAPATRYGAAFSVSATLTGAAGPLRGEPVTFVFRGRPSVTALTDETGVASLAGLAPGTLGAGTTPVDALFAGDALYAAATARTDLVIAPATPAIVWSPPAAIPYGVPLGGPQLRATATVAGLFAYTPPAGTRLRPGTHTLSVVFTPADANYGPATATASITVTRAVPQLVWDPPADIPTGTPLGLAQLRATADVPGTFSYTPDAGATLPAGDRQALTVLFTPTDAEAYTNRSASTWINIVDPMEITDSDRLEWEQGTLDIETGRQWGYALYVDETRVELTDVACGALADTKQFLCSAELPPLLPGTHSLRLATFSVFQNKVLESPPTMLVFVVKLATLPMIDR
jgi:uncharacterized repeat protein (TIGR03803 family)